MSKVALTVKELADHLGISMPTAYALTERSGFPVIRVGRKKIIPLSELERWISNEAQHGTSKGA